jgi:hypothetical protein
LKSSTAAALALGALVLAGGIAYAHAHGAPPAPPPRQGKALPWTPPGAAAGMFPVLVAARNTGSTSFPVDLWRWDFANDSIYLAVASDDPTSFVGYIKSPQGPQVMAQGVGPLTSQIEAQL